MCHAVVPAFRPLGTGADSCQGWQGMVALKLDAKKFQQALQVRRWAKTIWFNHSGTLLVLGVTVRCVCLQRFCWPSQQLSEPCQKSNIFDLDAPQKVSMRTFKKYDLKKHSHMSAAKATDGRIYTAVTVVPQKLWLLFQQWGIRLWFCASFSLIDSCTCVCMYIYIYIY